MRIFLKGGKASVADLLGRAGEVILSGHADRVRARVADVVLLIWDGQWEFAGQSRSVFDFESEPGTVLAENAPPLVCIGRGTDAKPVWRGPVLDWPGEVDESLVDWVASLGSTRSPFVQVETGPSISNAADAQSNARKIEHAKVIGELLHDFNAPLCVAWGYADLLKPLWAAPVPREQISAKEQFMLRGLCTHLEYLTELSRSVRTAGIAQHDEVVDLSAQIREVARHRWLRADTRGLVDLQVEGPDGLHVLGNPIQLRRVVDNALNNAVQAGATAVTFRLSVECGGTRVMLAVEDDGVGCGQAAASVLAGTKPKIGGGLGLYIMRRLIQAHRGEVVIRPRLPRGSVLEVRLPLAA
jgi:signal transduction histidine kinase